MNKNMLYFAYGSNLSTVRLTQRVPSSRLVASGRLGRHRLVFHKIGRDGSAKCDAWYTGRRQDYTLGAVYRIDPCHRHLLDAAEGLGNGYEIRNIGIVTDSGSLMDAFLYTATAIDRKRKPCHWYKEHVLRGMREHGFPDQYLAMVEAVEATVDADSARTAKELRMYTLPDIIDKA
ncbi:MAG: gamma-glutamylcyclotransferase family protein [Desulfobulbaceae bacterium]|nr:gamma-glutamylcyclotransferase family protein [Desulfobulbaceae bacterium]